MNHTCVFLNLTPFRNAFEFDLFIHSPLKHLDSFQFLIIINESALNVSIGLFMFLYEDMGMEFTWIWV